MVNEPILLLLIMRVLALLTLSTMVAGCSPEFETIYQYYPPKSFNGRKCVNECQLTLQQCEATEQAREQSCLDRVAMCESSKVMAPDPILGWNSPTCVRNCNCSKSCQSTNLDLCNGRYRTCYSNCGGTMSSYKQCVRYCNEMQ